MVMMTLYERQQKRHRCVEQSFREDILDSISLTRTKRNSRTCFVICQLLEQLLLLATGGIMTVMSGIPECQCVAASYSRVYFPFSCTWLRLRETL